MKKYNNSIFYKIKFNIAKKEKDIDLIWKIICHTRGCLIRKWNVSGENLPLPQNSVWRHLWAGGIVSSNDQCVRIQSCAFSENNGATPYWACRITEKSPPKRGYAPRKWITDIGIVPISNTMISFSFVVSYEDHPGFVGFREIEPDPYIPELIGCLLKDNHLRCTYGMDPVTVKPIKLVSGNHLSFWEQLRNTNRTVPYVLINTMYIPGGYDYDDDYGYEEEEGEDVPTINPEQMAVAVGGNALVYYADDSQVMYALNSVMPNEYRCPEEGVRIYFPNLNIDDALDPQRHRYIAGYKIDSFREERICNTIRKALVQDVQFYETFFQIEDCEKKKETLAREQRLLEIRTQYENACANEQKTAAAWFDYADEESNKRLDAEKELARVNAEMEEMKEERYILTSQIASLIGYAQENADLKRTNQARMEIKKIPQKTDDVVRYFQAFFGDKLAFSIDAEKSLKECNIPVDDMWDCFFALATTMHDLWNKGSADAFTQFKNITGINASPREGMMTRCDKQLMRQFATNYLGEQISIEAHITFANIGQSIHFGFSEQYRKIVIGSCGEHKEIYSSHKQK